MTTFNTRTQRARLSAGWAHDSRHFHFMRQHDSNAPFVESRSANIVAEAIVGALALFVLGLIVIFVGGAI